MAPGPVPIPEGLRVPEQPEVSQPCPPPPGWQSPGRPGGGRATPKKGLWGFRGGAPEPGPRCTKSLPWAGPPRTLRMWVDGGGVPARTPWEPPKFLLFPCSATVPPGSQPCACQMGAEGFVCCAPPSYKHLHPCSRAPHTPSWPAAGPGCWGGGFFTGFSLMSP